MKYTFSDDEDTSDGLTTRKSTRQQTRASSPAPGPTFTASGRQVKARVGGIYGEALTTRQRGDLAQESNATSGRPQRSTRMNGSSRNGHLDGYNSVDAMEEDDELDAASSGQEWDSGDNRSADEDEVMSDTGSLDEDDIRPSLVVQLRYGKVNETQQHTLAPTKMTGSVNNTAVDPSHLDSVAAPNGSAVSPEDHSSQDPVLPALSMEASGPTSVPGPAQPAMADGHTPQINGRNAPESSV